MQFKPVTVLKTSDENILKLDNLNEIMLYKLFLKPILEHKIVTVLIEGRTGSGKSMMSLALAERLEKIFSKIRGKNNSFDPIKQVVYVPTQYGDKLDMWVSNPYVTVIVDELRFLVPKQKWQSLLNQSIAEVNAVIRDVKIKNNGYGGIIIYNTQDISDISKDVRKTIDYDITIERRSRYPRVHIYNFWLDKNNIEKPILRHKKASFKISQFNFKIDKLIPVMPSTEVKRTFIKESVEAKTQILKRKRDAILNELRAELGNVEGLSEELKNDQVFEMVKGLAKWRKDKVTFSKEKADILKKMFSLSHKQFKQNFIPIFEEEARRRGLI